MIPPSVVQRKAPKKSSILTLRDVMTKLKPQVTAVPILEPVAVQSRKATTAKTPRPRPTVTKARGLQDHLSISQASTTFPENFSMASTTGRSIASFHSAERDKMRTFMTNLLKQQWESWLRKRCSEPLPVVEIVDNVSVQSEIL